MPSLRVINELKDQIHFVTFTVKNWYYLLDRHERFKLLEDSFVYCQQNKGLKVYGFVFMLNHLHFIGSAPDLGAVIRDMKKYLSKAFKDNLIENEPNILKLFEKDGRYEFWKKTNCPKLILDEDFFEQKLNYIHYNPVNKLYVHEPGDWRWSSVSKVSTRIEISELPI